MEFPWDPQAWKPTAGVFEELGVWDPPSKTASAQDNHSKFPVNQLTEIH